MAAHWHYQESSSGFESNYKSIESEEDTRNPTTNKKIHGTPVQFRRSNPYMSAHEPDTHPQYSNTRSHSISEQLNLLEAQKLQCMRTGRVKQAEALQGRIARVRSLGQELRMRGVEVQQQREKRAVSAAHRREMQHLHRAWQDYFQHLRQREIDILESFKTFQRKEIRQARQKLQRRCASMRSHSRQKTDLLRREQTCMAESRFKELRVVRKELKQLEEREDEARRRQVSRWAQLEEQRLSASQSRKYNALMGRLEQYRQDKEKIYVREQKRLKQKYKNVLAQLRHEQTMELSTLNRMLSFDH